MLVGRDAECLRITGALDQVRAGQGGTLLLTGPPGAGKTALLEYAGQAAGELAGLRATGVEFECRFARDPWPRLAVSELAPAGMAELVDSAGGAVAPDVRERLLRYADGNPLALLEIIANLSAEELAGRRPLPDPLPLGAGLEAAFLDQVHRLPAAAQELLLVAACADGSSWAQILAAAQRLELPGSATWSLPATSAAAGIEAAGLVPIGSDGGRVRHPLVPSALVSAA